MNVWTFDVYSNHVTKTLCKTPVCLKINIFHFHFFHFHFFHFHFFHFHFSYFSSCPVPLHQHLNAWIATIFCPFLEWLSFFYEPKTPIFTYSYKFVAFGNFFFLILDIKMKFWQSNHYSSYPLCIKTLMDIGIWFCYHHHLVYLFLLRNAVFSNLYVLEYIFSLHFSDHETNNARVHCRICLEDFQCSVHYLMEPIDVYNEWIDACEAAN